MFNKVLKMVRHNKTKYNYIIFTSTKFLDDNEGGRTVHERKK